MVVDILLYRNAVPSLKVLQLQVKPLKFLQGKKKHFLKCLEKKKREKYNNITCSDWAATSFVFERAEFLNVIKIKPRRTTI